MIERLEFILALARERHFGRAAQVCNVSQQTLSAGVKQLEERLGVLLVQRGSRFQGFTPEGERVLEWARRIVGDARAMREEVASLRRGLSGTLRLAAIPTATPIVAALTTPFRARHPDVRFSVQSTTSGDIGRLIADLEIDAGITYLENEPLGRLTAVPLYRERYACSRRSTVCSAQQDSVTWDEVARLPLCLLTPDMQNRRIIDRHLSPRWPPIDAIARVELHDRSAQPRPDGEMGEHHAGRARRHLSPQGPGARGADRRAGYQPRGRPRHPGAGADDAPLRIAARRNPGSGTGHRRHRSVALKSCSAT